jgi:hypothetical protein
LAAAARPSLGISTSDILIVEGLLRFLSIYESEKDDRREGEKKGKQGTEEERRLGLR